MLSLAVLVVIIVAVIIVILFILATRHLGRRGKTNAQQISMAKVIPTNQAWKTPTEYVWRLRWLLQRLANFPDKATKGLVLSLNPFAWLYECVDMTKYKKLDRIIRRKMMLYQQRIQNESERDDDDTTRLMIKANIQIDDVLAKQEHLDYIDQLDEAAIKMYYEDQNTCPQGGDSFDRCVNYMHNLMKEVIQ